VTKPAADALEPYRWKCERALGGHGNRQPSELLAEIDGGLGMDRYGEGGAVAALEEQVKAVLGKPAAVFMPSGTMAQQIALRIHAERRGVRTIGFHPTCHLELHEDKAYQRLHGLVGRAIGDRRELLTLQDLLDVRERLAAVVLELPQRELGGRLPAWRDLAAQVEAVRARGAAVHLDGARLWECTPFYRRSPADVCALFDTVYVSFYKGLGALAGCCLAGEEDVIGEARAWRTRHGGTLFGLWTHAASALAALRRRLPLMPNYYRQARAIAKALRGVRDVEVVPDPPQTPMMHVHLRVDPKLIPARAVRIAQRRSIFTFARTMPGPTPAVRVVELVVGDATLELSPDEVAEVFAELVSPARPRRTT
jgi:threonine aldolase